MTQTLGSPDLLSIASSGDQRRRRLGKRTTDDLVALGGAASASFASVVLAFAYVLPFDGPIGFTILWYVTFLAYYAGITALSEPRTIVTSRIAATLVSGAAAIAAAVLGSLVLFTFLRGFHALGHLNFFTHDMSGVPGAAPLDKGGIVHAIVGSLIEITIAVAITLPLGVGTALFMTEVGGRFARIVRTVIEAMTALPSIVAGLFIYTVLIVTIHFPRTGFAAALALSVMGLPILARAADVVLRIVPGGLREASLALGASQWQTVWRVVLPTARPGLATALILAVARMIGETSPVLLTSGVSSFYNDNPLNNPMNSLPLYAYFAVRSGLPGAIERGFGAAAALLAVVLVLFVVARRIARGKRRTS